jgi:hypothetical protein
MSYPINTPNHQQAVSIHEFGKRYSLSIATVFRLIRDQKIEARKCGRRTLITADAEKNWLDSLPRAGGAK